MERSQVNGGQGVFASFKYLGGVLASHAPWWQGLDAWERRWWRKGTSVAGVDEAGRGPLAGPAGTLAARFNRAQARLLHSEFINRCFSLKERHPQRSQRRCETRQTRVETLPSMGTPLQPGQFDQNGNRLLTK